MLFRVRLEAVKTVHLSTAVLCFNYKPTLFSVSCKTFRTLLSCYNNLESATYRYGAVSGKTDSHVGILKYPGGEFLFSRWGIKNSSEESNETSEETGLTHYNSISKISSGVIRASFFLRRSVDVALSLSLSR